MLENFDDPPLATKRDATDVHTALAKVHFYKVSDFPLNKTHKRWISRNKAKLLRSFIYLLWRIRYIFLYVNDRWLNRWIETFRFDREKEKKKGEKNEKKETIPSETNCAMKLISSLLLFFFSLDKVTFTFEIHDAKRVYVCTCNKNRKAWCKKSVMLIQINPCRTEMNPQHLICHWLCRRNRSDLYQK